MYVKKRIKSNNNGSKKLTRETVEGRVQMFVLVSFKHELL